MDLAAFDTISVMLRRSGDPDLLKNETQQAKQELCAPFPDDQGITDLRRLEVANKWMALHIRCVANHFLETDSFTFQNGGRFFTAGLSGNRVDLRGAN
jgi:hypothetical protein